GDNGAAAAEIATAAGALRVRAIAWRRLGRTPAGVDVEPVLQAVAVMPLVEPGQGFANLAGRLLGQPAPRRLLGEGPGRAEREGPVAVVTTPAELLVRPAHQSLDLVRQRIDHAGQRRAGGRERSLGNDLEALV